MDPTFFTKEAIPGGLTMCMAATMENIDRASTETQKFLHKNDLEALRFVICLGMREALTNAVRHGNAGIFERTIAYRIEATKTQITLQFMDEGPGFNWRTLKKKLPDAESGRGIPIMKSNFNVFRYNDLGNHLTLVKDIPPVSGPCSTPFPS